MNSKFENNEDKYINKKLAIISGIIVFAIVGCFFATYFITDRLTNPKYVNNNAERRKNSIQQY